jgi:hypothetical protein
MASRSHPLSETTYTFLSVIIVFLVGIFVFGTSYVVSKPRPTQVADTNAGPSMVQPVSPTTLPSHAPLQNEETRPTQAPIR